MAGPIVVIGNSTINLIMEMDHLPLPGVVVTESLFRQTIGSKGANQAVGAARAGGQVIFVSRVGDDQYGQLIREYLHAAGVNVDYVQEEVGIESGAALVMVARDGQNYVSVATGANNLLLPDDIDGLKNAILKAGIVVLQNEIRPDTLRRCINLAFHLGKKILLNLAPARPLEDAYLRYIYVLVVNAAEAEFIVGYAINNLDSARQAALDLKARGPLYVVIQLGPLGSYVTGPQVDQAVPSFAEQGIDAPAAGDAFCGSLAVALVEGRGMVDAVRFASAGNW